MNRQISCPLLPDYYYTILAALKHKICSSDRAGISSPLKGLSDIHLMNQSIFLLMMKAGQSHKIYLPVCQTKVRQYKIVPKMSWTTLDYPFSLTVNGLIVKPDPSVVDNQARVRFCDKFSVNFPLFCSGEIDTFAWNSHVLIFSILYYYRIYLPFQILLSMTL